MGAIVTAGAGHGGRGGNNPLLLTDVMVPGGDTAPARATGGAIVPVLRRKKNLHAHYELLNPIGRGSFSRCSGGVALSYNSLFFSFVALRWRSVALEVDGSRGDIVSEFESHVTWLGVAVR